MSALIDWKEAFSKDLGGQDNQNLSVLGQNIHITSPYLRLVLNNNDVSLILRAGPNNKERPYSLSDKFIPSVEGIIPLSQSPYVIAIINYLNTSLLQVPPTKLTSFKGFSDKLNSGVLIVEYFACRGKNGLSSVTKSDVKKFTKDVSDGWFAALKLQSRFERFSAIESPEWFEIRSGGAKVTNESRFKLEHFKESIGTSLFNKTLNDIPPLIVDKLDVPANIRTPYEYSSKFTTPLISNALVRVFTRLNELFFAQGLSKPIHDPTKEANGLGVRRAGRTKTPTVSEVYQYCKYLFSVLETGEAVATRIEAHRNIMLDPTLGTWRRQNAVSDAQEEFKSITVGTKSLKVAGYRQDRSRKGYSPNINESVSLGDAYKIYLGSVASTVLMFTGWRLEEVVNQDIGLAVEHIDYDPQSKLTLINRNILKSELDGYERQVAAVGPLLGTLLTNLHENNNRVAIDYTDESSLFSVVMAGPKGGSNSLAPDLSSNKRSNNPLRYFAELQNITVPTPKQLRRYFAIIYFYQFDHPEIMALSQHYGHGDLDTTDIYITDVSTKRTTKSIGDAIPIKNINTNDDPEFRKIFQEQRDAKLRDLVGLALGGKSKAGFQRTVRAIFRKIYQDSTFDDLNAQHQEKAIDSVFNQVKNEGFSVEVFCHGTCTNSPEHADTAKAKCGNEMGEMEREHATASLCSGCEFHDVQPQHVVNLKSKRATLQAGSDDIEDIFSCAKTPLERAQDIKEINELTAIIALYEDDEYAP